MTQAPRETRVLRAVVTLVDSLLDDFDVVELLNDLTEHCTQLLDVTAAGLLLAGPRGQLHLMAATSARSRHLELLQLQTEEGPCLDCHATGLPVTVADLSDAEDRWPRFVRGAVEAGFASVHAVPLRAAATTVGALGLFGTAAGHLDDADLLVAQTLAHIACVALLQDDSPTPATVRPRLRSALADRVVVEQAQGYLCEALGVTVPQALVLLRSYARTRGDRLTAVCRRLIGDPNANQPMLDALRGTPAPPTRPLPQ